MYIHICIYTYMYIHIHIPRVHNIGESILLWYDLSKMNAQSSTVIVVNLRI